MSILISFFFTILVSNNISSLWESYNNAQSKDRPRESIEILNKIKKKAKTQRLSYDFYNAWAKTVEVSSARNWKQRDSLMAQMRSELESYNDPTVLFYDSYQNNRGKFSSNMTFVFNNRSQLENSNNKEFYSNDQRITRLVFGQALSQFIENDFDYCLWALYSNDYNSENKEILRNRFQGQYPFEAFLELQGMDIEGHKRYEEKYKDKAVSLFSTQKILLDRFEKLNENPNSTSEDYIALKEDIQKTIKRINSFKGKEKIIALCCKMPESLLSQLNNQSVDAIVENGELLLLCRNTKRVSFRLYDKENKKIIDRNFTNTSNSFYTTDTISFRIDDKLEDGEYSIEYGKNQKLNYTKYTLSLAARRNNKGYGIYVADYMSGEPINDCRINLYDINEKPIAQSSLFPLNGFTALPISFSNKINNNEDYYIQAVFVDSKGVTHLSPLHLLSRTSIREASTQVSTPEEEANRLNGIVLCDRGAYNPSDTIFFKAIVYERNGSIKADYPIIAQLLDPNRKVIESLNLQTNDFGSVAAQFATRKDLLGGNYNIVIQTIENNRIANRNINIDEFVLPTFYLTWEQNDIIYLPGDDVEIRGSVKSYSGHNLHSASIHYSVSNNGDIYAEGPLEFDNDGNFSVKFSSNVDKNIYSNYTLNVVVRDSTGETWDYNYFVNFSNFLHINLELLNTSVGRFSKPHLDYEQWGKILADSLAQFNISSHYRDLELNYKLFFNDEEIESGEINKSDFSLNFAERLSGLYEIKVYALAHSDNGNEFKCEESLPILKVLDNDKALHSDIIGFFKEVKGYGLSLQIGATTGPIWAVAELYGDGNKLLDSKIIKLIGQKGETGSLQLIHFEHKDYYPENLSMNVIYFKDKLVYRYSKAFENYRKDNLDLPLEFVHFLDTTQPGTQYNFAALTKPGIEACVSIFDLSTENIRRNQWRIGGRSSGLISGSTVSYLVSCGSNDSKWGYSIVRRGRTNLLNAATATKAETMSITSDAIAEEVMGNEINVREKFANTLLWSPQLKADENGRIDLPFSTSDKLSKYYVQLLVHDKKMNSSVIRQEFSVTLPVKVSIVQPRYLYEGDTYLATMNVSNNFDEEIEGDVFIQFNDNEIHTSRVVLPAKASINFTASSGELSEGETTILSGFKPIENQHSSDVLRLSIPVRKASQTLSESHSSIVNSTDEIDLEINKLKSLFKNLDANSASVKTVSVQDLLQNAIPKNLDTETDNVISLSSNLYCAIKIGGILNEEEINALVNKIISCRNSDGGFGWYPGLSSNPMVTAKLLDRFYALAGNCPKYLSSLTKDAVQYLDRTYFGESAIMAWRGGLSLEEYLYIRSLYNDVLFSIKNINLKTLATFTKESTKYLSPKEDRGLNYRILAKARRCLTLKNFVEGQGTKKLFNAWGLSLKRKNALRRSLNADMESLSQYAIDHINGGVYFPNAIYPYRGLLSSELYAASLLCNLFKDSDYDDISEGLRLWMIIQKETQQWDNDPAFVDALCCVLDATEQTLNTKVLVLSAKGSVPFNKIVKGGNGFEINCVYICNGKTLEDGDKLHLGDKVIARYNIKSDENRSFVSIKLPRASCLRPLVQTSGFYAWRYPAYRYIKADESIYMFESFPEETTSFSEEFFVTNEGTFHSAIPTIESYYAPHYRANGEMISISVESTQP